MNALIENGMHSLGQLFLLPVLLAILLLFAFAFHALGAFLWQAWQRHRGQPAGFEIEAAHRADPTADVAELEALALKRLEGVRLASRTAPMLGLVATMIPMGPALKALAEGQLAEVSHSLMVAFSAVILSLIAAAITHVVGQVRKRWYAVELLHIEKRQAQPAGVAATPMRVAA